MLIADGYIIVLTVLLDVLRTMEALPQYLTNASSQTDVGNKATDQEIHISNLPETIRNGTSETLLNSSNTSPTVDVYKAYLIEAVERLQEEILARNLSIPLNASLLERFKEALKDDGFQIDFRNDEDDDGGNATRKLDITSDRSTFNRSSPSDPKEGRSPEERVPTVSQATEPLVYLKPFNLSNNYSVQILIEVREEDDDDENEDKVDDLTVDNGRKSITEDRDYVNSVSNETSTVANRFRSTFYEQSLDRNVPWNFFTPSALKNSGGERKRLDFEGPQLQRPFSAEDDRLRVGDLRLTIEKLRLRLENRNRTAASYFRKKRPLRRQGAFYFKGFPENLRNNKSRIENIRERCRMVTTSWNGDTLVCDTRIGDFNGLRSSKQHQTASKRTLGTQNFYRAMKGTRVKRMVKPWGLKFMSTTKPPPVITNKDGIEYLRMTPKLFKARYRKRRQEWLDSIFSTATTAPQARSSRTKACKTSRTRKPTSARRPRRMGNVDVKALDVWEGWPWATLRRRPTKEDGSIYRQNRPKTYQKRRPPGFCRTTPSHERAFRLIHGRSTFLMYRRTFQFGLINGTLFTHHLGRPTKVRATSKVNLRDQFEIV